jgi:hypothetical protein
MQLPWFVGFAASQGPAYTVMLAGNCWERHMLSIEPTGAILGATVHGIDVTRADERDRKSVV